MFSCLFGFIDWSSLLVPDASLLFFVPSLEAQIGPFFLNALKCLKIVLMIQTIKTLKLTENGYNFQSSFLLTE
jgi:hypothetical protein